MQSMAAEERKAMLLRGTPEEVAEFELLLAEQFTGDTSHPSEKVLEHKKRLKELRFKLLGADPEPVL